MTTQRLPTYFISHGGGPWPYMAEFRKKLSVLEASLVEIARELHEKPRAVLVISGHWEAAEFSVMANPHPPMVYDYYGFPEHTYHVTYPAPGDVDLAHSVQRLIGEAGMTAVLDTEQGFDHGTFTPLVIMYPDADVPVVQLSLKAGYDPATHIAVGRALAPLRDQGVLIVGSGLSYHNLREFGPGAKVASKAFDDWLQAHMLNGAPLDREAALLAWSEAPAARLAHPREDHLIPLMVAAGAAHGEEAALVYHEENLFGGVTASSFRFGAVPVAEALAA